MVICLPEIHLLSDQDLEGPHSGVTTTESSSNHVEMTSGTNPRSSPGSDTSLALNPAVCDS